MRAAFDLFKRHQRWLLRSHVSRDESMTIGEPQEHSVTFSSIFSRNIDDPEGSQQPHNDITFGCLIDVLVRNGQIKEAE